MVNPDFLGKLDEETTTAVEKELQLREAIKRKADATTDSPTTAAHRSRRPRTTSPCQLRR